MLIPDETLLRIADAFNVIQGAASRRNLLNSGGRTALSRTSGEYLFVVFITPSFQYMESLANPGRFKTPYEAFDELTGLDVRNLMGYAFIT